MSRRVWVHLGLPKTGTTYLQTILWAHREDLRAGGLLLPGHRRQHLWASGVVREEPRLERRHADAPHAWRALVDELAAWPGDGLVTHEFFSGASRAQAARAVTDLGDAEVHLVLTVREVVALVTSRWQEWVKNGGTGPIDSYPPHRRGGPGDEWSWATLDVADVLGRWAGHVPPDRVHVICPVGPDAAPDELWRRFADVVEVDPDRVDTGVSEANESLGLASVELLRRVNGHLDLRRPSDRGTWLRGYLAHQMLLPQGGDRFWPGPARVAELRAVGERGLEALRAGGYDVRGDLDLLRTPDPLPGRRHPDEVTEAEMLEVAAATIARLVEDVRARAEVAAARPDSGARRVIGRLRRLGKG